MEPTVSAIIPTRDRARTVLRAVRSVLAQTRPPDEVIVVDDGSADETVELLAREAPEARVLQQSQRGVSGARNRGIEAASSEWIAFLDSDDEWKTNKLERQLEELERCREARVCHTDEIWVRRGNQVLPRRRHRKRGGWIFRHCLPLCAISPSTVLLHRQVLEAVGVFDESLPACEDYDLWLRVCSRYPVLFVDEPLVIKYGGHDDQLSRRYPVMDRFRVRALEKILVSAELPPADRQAVRQTLAEKLEILLGGAAKRGLEEEAASYREKLERYC